ncbi:MAG: LA_3696 family protein [Gemmatimonadota bacterium]
MTVIHVPDALRDRLGPEATKALVELISGTETEIRADVIQLAEERFARRLAEAIAALETRLTERMAALERRVLRWTFAFWVVQLGVLLGIFFGFHKP